SVHQSNDRLVNDPTGQQQQYLAVDERRQRLVTPMAIGAPYISGAASYPDGQDGQQQRCRVGQHVRRLGEQCNRVGEIASDPLNQGEGAENAQRYRQPALAGVAPVDERPMRMGMCPVVVAMWPVGMRSVGVLVIRVRAGCAHADSMPPMGPPLPQRPAWAVA